MNKIRYCNSLHSITNFKRRCVINVIKFFPNIRLWWHCWWSSKQDIGFVCFFVWRNGLRDILLCAQFSLLDSPITKIVLNIQKAFHEAFCTCLSLVILVTFKSSYGIRGYHNYVGKSWRILLFSSSLFETL